MDVTLEPISQSLRKLAQVVEIPDWVQAASPQDACGDASLPDRVFADPARRRFPHHTKAAAWLSLALYRHDNAEYPESVAQVIEQRLKRAAAFLGLTDAEIRTTERQKTAAATPSYQDDDYLWTDRGIRKLPVRSAVELQKAASWLRKYRDDLPWDDRRKIASRIREKAASLGANIQEYEDELERMSGCGTCCAGDVADMLERRAVYAVQSNPEFGAELRKFASMLVAAPEQLRSAATLDTICRTVDAADRQIEVRPGVKLAASYGPTLQRPEDVLFALNMKTAETFVRGHVPTVTGALYDRQSLSQVRVAKVAELLGDELARDLTVDGLHVDPTKAAAVIPTLPRPDLRLFEQAAKAAGVEPVVAADSTRPRLTDEDLHRLAAEYQTA